MRPIHVPHPCAIHAPSMRDVILAVSTMIEPYRRRANRLGTLACLTCRRLRCVRAPRGSPRCAPNDALREKAMRHELRQGAVLRCTSAHRRRWLGVLLATQLTFPALAASQQAAPQAA